MMSKGKTPWKDPEGSLQLLRGISKALNLKGPKNAVDSFEYVVHTFGEGGNYFILLGNSFILIFLKEENYFILLFCLFDIMT
jgi:hypothetical protein